MNRLTDRSQRPSLARLGRVETRKMVDTRAATWVLILTVISAVGAVLVDVFVESADRDFGGMFVDALLAASVLMPIVPILLITSEWSQRNALGTFTLVPVRERAMAAKLLALLVLLIGFTALCLGLSALGAAAGGEGFGFSAAEGGEGVLYLLLNLLLGFGLAAVTMNSPAAIVLFYLSQILIAAIAAISAGVEAVVTWIDLDAWSSLTDTASPDWGKVLTVTLAWVALPIALGLIRLRRRDIS
jgi:hypothetical protein